MNDLQLTKNFWLSEFTTSRIAASRGIDNSPSLATIENLTLLCKEVLQPLRDAFDSPLIVTSGYRCWLVNVHARGSRNSQHLTGQAADFTIPGVPRKDVAHWLWKHCDFDQLIHEFDSWIHVSYCAGRNRKELLTINSAGVSKGFK